MALKYKLTQVMRQIRSILLVLGMLTFSITKLSAQVTIGSSDKTIPGALLQIKTQQELSPGGSNATKGLGMPRVALNTPDKLYPMLPNGYNSTEDGAHIGLIVYNTTAGDGFCPGLYVWDGGKWEELVPVSKPDITVTDIDGNTYTARWFSSIPCDPNANGAYWFTSNLRVTRQPDGSALPGSIYDPNDNRILMVGAETQYDINSLADLQSGTIGYGEDESPIPNINNTVTKSEYAKKFGLMYRWEQAKVACPTGWHLPDYTEWEALLNYFGGAATAGAKMRINNNYFYTNQNYVPAGTNYKWGQNDPANIEFSGFNAVPAGWTNSAGGVVDYAGTAFWWTTDNMGMAMTYKIHYDDPGVHTQNNYENDYLSVRCVHD